MIAKLKDKLNKDIHLKELLKGSSIAFVIKVLGLIAGYIFTLIITRGYGAEAMGIFALSFTVLQIASVVGRVGMDTALLRFVAEYSSQGKWDIVKDIYKKAIKLVIPISLILSILVFLLSPYIAEYIFHKPYLFKYFQIVSIGILPFVLLYIHTESIRGLKKIKEYMFLQQAGIFILSSIILGLITFFIYKNFLHIRDISQIPLLVFIFSIIIISITAYFLWIKFIQKRQEQKIDKEKLSYAKILHVSIPMLFSSSLALIMGWTDTIMLGMFRTEEEVGIYNVALRLATVTSITLMAINTIAAPKFAEFWGKKDIEGLSKVAQQSTKIVFWTSFPILIIFLIFPKQILDIFGEEFKAGALALIVLTIGQFVNAVAGSVGYILDMTGNQKFVQNIIFIGALLNIILNYLLIPIFGILGAAIASAISMIFWNFMFSIKVKYILKTWIFYPRLYKRRKF
ncbi:flippase [Hydrogenothermus marinus]|uniref:O-antigen/teichoic acid export membrane protein n=1 Tax=Hydrogenothermus marinus TaxID=133270 RepID=A0A3M0B854_9AQUI|nr:flippase [Hydrogenothermus marinus]RMA93317.1 O-antigen/teichoic acid export membrane protein [Hydrogenothermus marinus]